MSCCEHNHDHQISRRGLGRLLAGGLFLLPQGAFAAGDVAALALVCIDYRLVAKAVPFFDGLGLDKQYDQVELAGASLAAVSPKFPAAGKAFWDQLQIAKDLHHVKKLIALDHRDCGAYKVAFGKDFKGSGPAEAAQHKMVMRFLQKELAHRQPDLGFEGYLMALDGTAERLI